MRKFFNVLTAFAAAGICIFMTMLSLDADIYTLAYNLVILGIMAVIILFAGLFGFLRMHQTANGLDRASGKLIDIYKNKGAASEITGPGTRLFEVDYLDRKYQEYVAYLRKTNSPCDIGDYIGEYEINNYTHRRLVEMVPDILTSLGILGTFVGLVWGLRGFDPVSYETMASSVSSLVNGIKVAFITSIYGITLSMAFSYWLRGALSGLSESLDNFLDKYYLCAVPPTDATAMNRVLSNQKKQIKATESMSQELSSQMAESFESHMGPAMEQLNATMDHFTEVVTLHQEELLQNIAAQVTESMRKEFMGEFLEMRALLKDSNRVQRDYVQFLSEAQTQFQKDFTVGEREMTRAMKATSSSQEECLAAMKVQQEHLRDFVDYMSQAMEKLSRMNELGGQTLEHVLEQMDRVSPGPKAENEQLEALNERLERLILMMERQQRQQQNKKGFFRSGR
ncbi:MAG: MotA/TolQ/ExbB proton channel family protein [Lachnospiraceae bacterium]|nr:MotA/TolQ/ExbB proton channel family protein [Lachnospiraceae bacterium]